MARLTITPTRHPKTTSATLCNPFSIPTAEESFTHGLLEYPQYTRPAEFEGAGVPEILVSGNHGAVRRWRLKESLRRTLQRRPDLLADRAASPEERQLLDELAAEGEPGTGHD